VELIGPYLAACLLLVGAGVAKAWRPDDTARALVPLLGSASPAAVRLAVRVAAGAEAVLGACAMVWPAPGTASLVAASYAGFAGFVLHARRRGGALATCGCFGRADTPPTRLHVVVDLSLAGAALSVALRASDGGWLPVLLARQPWHGLPLVLTAAVCAWLVFHALSTLPRALASARVVRGEAR